MSKADDIFWRQFGAILLALIVFGFACAFIARIIAGGSHEAQINSPSAVAERIAPVASVRVGDPMAQVAAPASETQVAAAPAAAATADKGESVYQSACVACHLSGAAGAPKLDDEAAWAPRLELGEDALVASVVNGKGAMPANGGNPSLSEEDIRAAVVYMIGKVTGESAAATPAAAAPVAAAAPAEAAKETAEKAAEVVEKVAEKASEAAGTAAGAMEKPAESATAAVATASAAAAVPSDGKPGDEVYNMGCVACHATGAANAPKLDDKAAWESRMAAGGLAALVQTVISGKGAMPPKGGVPTLTEGDIANAVRHMLEEAGVAAGG